jgi:hypothetical protein
MNKGLIICLTLFTAVFSAPLAASTEPIIVTCHSCTAKKAKLTASGQVPMTWRAGVYDVYVVDNPGKILRLYRVTAEREGRDGFNYVTAGSPSAEYQTYFNQAISEWNYVSKALKAEIVLDPAFPIQTAEQVFGNAFNQTVISEQININVPTRIGSLFGAAFQIAGAVFKINVKINLLVQFPDGSTALFELVRLNHLTSGHFFVYEYRKGSALDNEGNRIPDSVASLENYQGTFSTPQNWSRFQRRADIYGADFLRGFQNQRLPAHSVCAIGAKGRVTCWHN